MIGAMISAMVATQVASNAAAQNLRTVTMMGASRHRSNMRELDNRDLIPNCDDPDAVAWVSARDRPILMPWGIYVTP